MMDWPSMQIARFPDELPPRWHKPVLALGNFDGLHRGHMKIIDRVRQQAGERGGTPAAMTFEPHPPRVVRPDKAPPLLMTTAQKLADDLKEAAQSEAKMIVREAQGRGDLLLEQGGAVSCRHPDSDRRMAAVTLSKDAPNAELRGKKVYVVKNGLVEMRMIDTGIRNSSGFELTAVSADQPSLPLHVTVSSWARSSVSVSNFATEHPRAPM